MTTLSYSLPTIGNPNSTEDPLIRTALSDIKTFSQGNIDTNNINPAAGIVGGQLANSTVTDGKLASPNNSVYKTLLAASGPAGFDLVAGTYGLMGARMTFSAGSLTSTGLFLSGNSLGFGNAGGVIAPALIYFDDADYTVGTLTQKLRLRAQVNTNATAWSSVTATFGLYPVTFAGAADDLTATLGTVVSGSTVAIANPSASTTNQSNSGDFTVPSDGQYCLGVVTSATLTNNALALLTAQLQTRNVV